MSQTLILIPAYNEGDNIKKVIESLLDLQLDADILVVNDGSTDQTLEEIQHLSIKTISHSTNLGYAGALQTGFKYAYENQYDNVIQFDGDGQHSSLDILEIQKALQNEKVDIVIGSRFLNPDSFKMGYFKKFVIQLFRVIIKVTTKKQLTDPTSGFRGYKRHVFKEFITPNGFPSEFPDSNFLIELLLKENAIKEIPVSMKLRENGVSMHSGLKPLIYVIQILLSTLIVWLRYQYKKEVKQS